MDLKRVSKRLLEYGPWTGQKREYMKSKYAIRFSYKDRSTIYSRSVDNWLKTLTKGSWNELMITTTLEPFFHKKARRLTSLIIKTVTMNRKEEILQFEGRCKKWTPTSYITPFITIVGAVGRALFF